MQEDAVRKYGLIILLSALFFQMVFAEGGVFEYIKTKREIAATNTSIANVEKENELLSQEIKRLHTDDKYLEDVVRRKYGFLREGEKLYRTEQ
jgi:cell division protein FtsB